VALSFDFNEFDDDDDDEDDEVSDNISSNQESAELNAGKTSCITVPLPFIFVNWHLS